MKNFYIDFEATHHSGEVISVGCVAENGKTFKCLVKPSDLMDVTPFITKLTGLTQEEVQKNGLAPWEAFSLLYDFLLANGFTAGSVCYCYGTEDRRFLRETISRMTDKEGVKYATLVKDSLVDFSKEAKRRLNVNGVSLKHLYEMVECQEVVQKHDSLEDALMLKECVEHFPDVE